MRVPMSKSHFQWAVILGFAGFILAWGLIFSSESYTQAKVFLNTSPEVHAEFGDIKHSFLYVAGIKNSHANFRFYVFGEKKNASIAIRADEDGEHWTARRSE
jgi:hypothetical protein